VQAQLVRGTLTIVFGAVMLGIQAYVFFGPPPVSGSAAALTALVSYAVFAAVIRLLERKRGLSPGTA
jgi:drug/metabolite transporter (DMT)-like permease